MASMLSGPIPQHPMYSKGGQNPSPRTAPRVKPEASSFASHGHTGTIGNLFELKGTSCFSPPKPKKEPRDHVAENVRRMRQIQRKCRQKQREEEISAPVPVKALWKSQKYESVPSKLAEFLEKGPETPTRPRSASYLRAHSRTGIPPTPPRPQSSRTPRAPRPSSPHTENKPPINGVSKSGLKGKSASCSDLSATGTAMNFIKVNALAASRQQVKRPPSQTSLEESLNVKAERYNEYKRSVKGTVPKYLEKRREEWRKEEEERIRNIPDPDMPEGHKLMPINERLDMLKLLQQSHKDLTSKLASLPIGNDTLRARTAKEQLETKLAEVEEAVKIFSRPKVFVKIDGNV